MTAAAKAAKHLNADHLQRRSAFIRQHHGDWWQVRLAAVPPVTARRDRDWLVMRALLDLQQRTKTSEARLVEMLRENCKVPWPTKLAISPTGSASWLLADIPLDEEGDVDGQVAQACTAFQRSTRMVIRRRAASQVDETQAAQSRGEEMIANPCQDVAQLFQEAGWTSSTRPDGQVVVPLEVPDAFCQASIEPADDGRLRVAVDLGSLPSPGAARLACALLLLRAAYHIRMARPAATVVDGQTACRWEVLLDDDPRVVQAVHALSTLTLACRFCLREFRTLQDESTARAFLTVQGWADSGDYSVNDRYASKLPNSNCDSTGSEPVPFVTRQFPVNTNLSQEKNA